MASGRAAIAQQLGERKQQAIVETGLGILAFEQGKYAEAQARHEVALHTFQALGDPAEATTWHQLGRVAQRQHQWPEAERCYRASLAYVERLDDTFVTAMTYNQLAQVAEDTERSDEAEGWYRRALERIERVHPGEATVLYNLANLLVNEVSAGRAAIARLIEAKRYAERALVIQVSPEASGETWKTLKLLAKIADLEGHVEEARNYRRRTREILATFASIRDLIDRDFGPLIAAIAAGAQGNGAAQASIEAALPGLEAKGWRIAAATRRLWAGERNWHALAESLEDEEALLILRVLETIASLREAPAQPAPEAILTSLPTSILDVLQQRDQVVFDQALAALSPEEQQRVLAALQTLQDLVEG